MQFPWDKPKDPFRRFDRQTVEEVMKAVGIDPASLTKEARESNPAKILDYPTFFTIPDGPAYFAEAMTTELEHGKAGDEEQTNVTDDVPLATAMIAAAHIKGVEFGAKKPYRPYIDYYDALWFTEGVHEMAWDKYLANKK